MEHRETHDPTTSNQRGSTNLPDVEDVNNDNTMNRINSYFEYRIPIRRYNTKQNNPLFLTLEKTPMSARKW